MKEIAWKDENKNWQNIVIKQEIRQLSLAFVLICVVTFIVCSATKIYSSHDIFALVAFLYLISLLCVMAQRWVSYQYKINEVELTVFNTKGKAELINANNSTVSTIKRFDSFNVVHIVKDARHYSVYINSDSEEWEILHSLLNIPTSTRKSRF